MMTKWWFKEINKRSVSGQVMGVGEKVFLDVERAISEGKW